MKKKWEPDEEVKKVVNERRTLERLAELTDRIQGFETRGGRNEIRGYGFREFSRDSWATLIISGTLRKIAIASVPIVVLAFYFLVLRVPGIHLQTDETSKLTAGSRLPDTLTFEPDTKKFTLSGGLNQFRGNLIGPRRGGGTTLYDASFSNRLADGTIVTFSGSLIITNRQGTQEIQRKSDLAGATLKGKLTVGTNSTPIDIDQPFKP